MKLTILTQYYPPEMGAPQNRLSDLARRFRDAGHQVTVLTAMPNYPTGKIFSGYGGLSKREKVDGIDVIRTFIYPAQSAGMVRRLANYFSFVFSSALLGTALLSSCDYLLCESPPLFLGLAGWWLSRVHRARLIFNVSDLWPESALYVGALNSRESTAYKLSEKLEDFCYRAAWCVTGQSRSIVDNIRKRFPTVRTYRLSNGVDTRRFTPATRDSAFRAKFGGPDDCILLYAGLHGLAQGLEQIIECAERLRHNQHLKFVFVGDGPRKRDLINDCERRGLRNVLFLDPVTAAEMPQLLSAADVLLVPLLTYIPGAVPSKLYEAMAAGRPVLLMASSEAADVVKRSNAGVALEPGDLDGFVAAAERLQSDPGLRRQLGANGRNTAEQEFDRQRIGAEFINFLEVNHK